MSEKRERRVWSASEKMRHDSRTEIRSFFGAHEKLGWSTS